MQLLAGNTQNCRKHNQMKVKKITLIVVSVLLAAYVVVAFPFVKLLKKDDCCKDIDINIDYTESVKFVSYDFISSQLHEMGIDPIGKRIADIDIADIEKRLKGKDYIENVECYFTSDNRLVIDLQPLHPVMRVFDADDSYYVNKEGKRMQSNANFFIDRPVVKGRFTPEYQPTRLLPLIEFMENSERWRNLAGMIEVRDSNNIFLIPKVANHVINLGNTDGLESKFAKLARMYNEVIPVKGWNFYDTISLKWDYQIVATRRKGGSRLNIVVSTDDDDEQAPDISTVATETNTNDSITH